MVELCSSKACRNGASDTVRFTPFVRMSCNASVCLGGSSRYDRRPDRIVSTSGSIDFSGIGKKKRNAVAQEPPVNCQPSPAVFPSFESMLANSYKCMMCIEDPDSFQRQPMGRPFIINQVELGLLHTLSLFNHKAVVIVVVQWLFVVFSRT